jgi:hypothetical protein
VNRDETVPQLAWRKKQKRLNTKPTPQASAETKMSQAYATDPFIFKTPCFPHRLLMWPASGRRMKFPM